MPVLQFTDDGLLYNVVTKDQYAKLLEEKVIVNLHGTLLRWGFL